MSNTFGTGTPSQQGQAKELGMGVSLGKKILMNY